jgi:hypothetical protein
MDCDSGSSVTDSLLIAELHRLEVLIVSGSVLVVALLAAGIAAIANRKCPHRTLAQLTTFTVLALVVGLFALTIAWMLWFMSVPCPEDSVCDAGAMAAAGVILFGAIEVITALVVGAPVAYFTLRAIRGR